MSSLLRPCLLVVLLVPALAHAAALDSPRNGSFYSGAGVISGWKCQAEGELTMRFNGGDPIPLIYGTERPDVLDVGACPSADVGFVAIWNWARLRDGTHTAVAYDEGVEFARATFTVTTTGKEFLPDADAECVIWDFPALGDEARFTWNASTQHLELTEFYRPLPPAHDDAWCLATENDLSISFKHGHFCATPDYFHFPEDAPIGEDCTEAIDAAYPGLFTLHEQYQDRQACLAALRLRCPEGITEGEEGYYSAYCRHDYRGDHPD